MGKHLQKGRSRRARQLKKLHAHVSERQAWELFIHQSRYIAAGLRTFIHMKRNGIPSAVFELACKRKGKDHTKAEKWAEWYWDALLRRMWYAFNEITNEHPDSPLSAWYDSVHRQLEREGKPFFECLPNKPDEPFVQTKCNCPPTPKFVLLKERRYQKTIQKGLRSYADYFECLWD